MSTIVMSGGFPHLYSHEVPGSQVDASAVRSVANADVAELHAKLEPTIAIDDDVHLINVVTKRAVTATEFKQMFYARGDDEFSIANVYECPDIDSNILASVWGKRVVSILSGAFPIYDVNDMSNSAINVGDDNLGVLTADIGTALSAVGTEVVVADPLGELTVNGQNVGALPDSSILLYVLSAVVNGLNTDFILGAGPLDTSGVDLSGAVTQVTMQKTGVLPYNSSRVMNYNKLSSRPNDPSGVDLAYSYTTDLQRNFYALHEVMGNLEKDLCVKKENWTLCSRMAVEDQLHNLAFAPEKTDSVCMTITCARKWSEVEDALAESCLAENNIIGLNDYVDLYINVRVTNGNIDTKDTIIRIRFTVQLTRGPDDLGNWNVVSSNAASAVMTTGIPRDAVEGGNLQYANASQTEISPNSNPSWVQPPNSVAPGNLSNAIDGATGFADHDVPPPPKGWVQLGSTLDGVNNPKSDSHNWPSDGLAGFSVAYNSDSTIVAVGAPMDNTNNIQSGSVKVFKYRYGIWEQMGETFIGDEMRYGKIGFSVSLNKSGTILAYGATDVSTNPLAPYNGEVPIWTPGVWGPGNPAPPGGYGTGHLQGKGRVYIEEWDGGDPLTGQWSPKGGVAVDTAMSITAYSNNTPVSTLEPMNAQIAGIQFGDRAGASVSLSSDGTKVAVGSTGGVATGQHGTGSLRVYEYVDGSSPWALVGAGIAPEGNNDLQTGNLALERNANVSLSRYGNMVAFGADGNNGGAGHVRVYEYVNSAWTQVGSDIDGVAGSGAGWSVSLRANYMLDDGGAPIVAIGGKDWNNNSVYRYTNGSWTQLGGSLTMVKDGVNSKQVVTSLSWDGQMVALATYWGLDASGAFARVYQYDRHGVWGQVGQDIEKVVDDLHGWSVSLAGNGHRVAVGAPGANLTPGVARTYIYQVIN